jgi:hypothetical protein
MNTAHFEESRPIKAQIFFRRVTAAEKNCPSPCFPTLFAPTEGAVNAQPACGLEGACASRERGTDQGRHSNVQRPSGSTLHLEHDTSIFSSPAGVVQRFPPFARLRTHITRIHLV